MTLGRTRSRSLSPCFSRSASAGQRPRACQREGHGSSPGAGSPAPFPGAAPRAPQGPMPSVGDSQPEQSWRLPEGDGVLGQGCGWRGAFGDRATQAPPARAYRWCIYSLPHVPLQHVGALLNGLLFAEGSVLIFQQQFLPLNGKNSWKRKKGCCPCWCPGEPGVRGMGWSRHHGNAGSACPSSMPRVCGCALRVGTNILGGKFKVLMFDATSSYQGHRCVPGKGHRGVGSRLTAGSAPWGAFSIFSWDKYHQERRRAWADG